MRAIRKAQKMSLRSLAQVTGLDRGYLSRLERGLIRYSTDSSVRKIADAFEVPPEAITQGEEVTDEASTAPPAKRTPQSRVRAVKAVDVESELVRWTPEQVADKRLLPYTARVLRRKCNRREIFHHNDGGKITFTADDIRRENARTQVAPIAA